MSPARHYYNERTWAPLSELARVLSLMQNTTEFEVSSSEVDVLPNISPIDPNNHRSVHRNIENIARDVRRVTRAQRR